MMARGTLLFLILITAPYLRSSCQTIGFENIEELQKSEKRPVLVFIQTGWCKYCGSMKQSLLRNAEISTLLGKKFYVVSLDGEEKKAVSFAGREFRYKPTGKNTGVHELAAELGTVNGQLSYPVICFLNQKNEIIYQYAGYLNPEALMKVLTAVDGSYGK